MTGLQGELHDTYFGMMIIRFSLLCPYSHLALRIDAPSRYVGRCYTSGSEGLDIEAREDGAEKGANDFIPRTQGDHQTEVCGCLIFGDPERKGYD